MTIGTLTIKDPKLKGVLIVQSASILRRQGHPDMITFRLQAPAMDRERTGEATARVAVERGMALDWLKSSGFTGYAEIVDLRGEKNLTGIVKIPL